MLSRYDDLGLMLLRRKARGEVVSKDVVEDDVVREKLSAHS